MGGYGSGNRYGGSRSDRETVEDCLALDINSLVRKRLFVLNARSLEGILTWTRGEREIGSCVYSFNALAGNLEIKLRYTYNDTEQISCTIYLEAIAAHLGGKRLYLICPECGKRRWHLYLNHYVKCRVCHDLTYESCRESHKFDSLYARMAIGMNTSMAEVRKAMNFMKRNCGKCRERKEGLSRRGRKKKAVQLG